MFVAEQLKNIIEAALLAAGRSLSLDVLQGLFNEIECPNKKELRDALGQLTEDYQGRGIEIAEVASGWRIQVGEACSPWVSRLWDERPARYSRALMETLALIAYRQPITRGEIEDIRGVSVSTNIVKTLIEREWVHVVGQRDVPGKPSLYATTREFLDYFGLKSLDDLPTLAELRDLDEINRELDLEDPDAVASVQTGEADDSTEQEAGAGDRVPEGEDGAGSVETVVDAGVDQEPSTTAPSGVDDEPDEVADVGAETDTVGADTVETGDASEVVAQAEVETGTGFDAGSAEDTESGRS